MIHPSWPKDITAVEEFLPSPPIVRDYECRIPWADLKGMRSHLTNEHYRIRTLGFILDTFLEIEDPVVDVEFLCKGLQIIDKKEKEE